jgi:hypothetical protein
MAEVVEYLLRKHKALSSAWCPWPTPVILATQEAEIREDHNHGSKPSQANSSQDPISKKHHKRRAGGVVHGIDPEFKP